MLITGIEFCCIVEYICKISGFEFYGTFAPCVLFLQVLPEVYCGKATICNCAGERPPHLTRTFDLLDNIWFFKKFLKWIFKLLFSFINFIPNIYDVFIRNFFQSKHLKGKTWVIIYLLPI